MKMIFCIKIAILAYLFLSSLPLLFMKIVLTNYAITQTTIDLICLQYLPARYGECGNRLQLLLENCFVV
jgi:hypothetical protein